MIDKPIRIQRRRTKGWKMPPNTVCVDRTTGFGSPFPVTPCTTTSMGKSARTWCVGTWEGPAMWFRDTKDEAAEVSVKAFRAWVEQPRQSALRDKARLVLRGKTLACWCAAGSPCHGDVWLEISNAD